MKKLLLLGLLALATQVEAGTISRTYTYTDGNTISANENNTNENTLYTEINGLLDAANIEDGTLTNADMADTQLTRTKFASAVQSTFTYIDTFGAYRRPNLVWINATTVDVSTNTGTSNETCIHFPDERRCVTENVASTSVNRRFIISDSASLSGTKNSGLRSGYVETVNTWYALYAVKTTDVATDFVIVGDTITPNQSNFSALNSAYGTNGWLYLGWIRNGDNSASTGDILNFTQSGNMIFFKHVNGTAGANHLGIRLANTASATSLTWTATAGTGAAEVPSNVEMGLVFVDTTTGAAVKSILKSSTAFLFQSGTNTGLIVYGTWAPLTQNLVHTNSAGENEATSISLSAFIDTTLGVGFNPQL